MYFRIPHAHILLFNSWEVNKSAEGTTLAVIVAFVIAILSEILGVYITRLTKKVSQEHELQRYKRDRIRLHCYRLLLSSIYFVFKLMRYLLMLVAMTYNAALLLAVITGAGFGYFFTDQWKRSHLQRKQEYVLSATEGGSDQNENISTSNEVPSTSISVVDQMTFPLISMEEFDGIPATNV